jgi:hypothetical protein
LAEALLKACESIKYHIPRICSICLLKRVQLEARVNKQGENGRVTQFVIGDLQMVICYPAAA